MINPPNTPPNSEAELAARARALAGMTLEELARATGIDLPTRLNHHKGQIGECVERLLGADASNRPIPDFSLLGIELKTIPLSATGEPRESTYVCRVNPSELIGERWETSVVRNKLSRVLWMPVEASPSLPLARRRLGIARIWSPNPAEEKQLKIDWEELTELVVTGRYDQIDARMGNLLQLRPKAASGRDVMAASDDTGESAATLPRGFYLRPSFTRDILAASDAI